MVDPKQIKKAGKRFASAFIISILFGAFKTLPNNFSQQSNQTYQTAVLLTVAVLFLAGCSALVNCEIKEKKGSKDEAEN